MRYAQVAADVLVLHVDDDQGAARGLGVHGVFL
jgi:hypothetical protein